MTIGELIEVRDFPAVVQAAEVRALRGNASNGAADDFIGGYLGFDERSRDALSATVRSLAGAQHGGGFFLNGVFGSGKSHLLGLLALLCDGKGHAAFAATQPHLAPALGSFGPRLIVHFSLDNYNAARFSLEDIFWREVRDEWARLGLPPTELQLPEVGARSEFFAALDESLQKHQLGGLVVCIDELSLFLSAKEHRALQSDAAFLQFLGQRARRAPLWVFAALQKTMEDVGDLDAYSISQIRDRFSTLPLSLAHVPSLIERRLIVRKNPAALQEVCRDSLEALARALPRLDFGRAEWEPLYPFHPATVALLEQVVSRFFSRTRSAALFCAQTAREAIDADAATRILPDALFDYIEPELGAHPDLRPLVAVWAHWRETARDLVASDEDARHLRRLMKGLLLFKIAGAAPTALQLANALALDARLPGDGNYEYTRVLLEKLRVGGGHVAVERHDGDFTDRYTLDLGPRISEMARRFIQNTLGTLPPGDARLAHYVAACCRDEPLPLAAGTARAYITMWRNAPRHIAVETWNAALSPEALANRLALLAQPGQAEDALVLLVPPFSDGAEAARACCENAMNLVADARWRAACILWTPRRPTADESENAREATAAHLLEADPQLLDNRRGRAVLAHLKNAAPEREATLGRLGARLMREGALVTGAGAAIEAAELAARDSWGATLEAVAEFALPHVFPHFEEVAPRLRVLTSSNADALCLDILRRPANAPFFAASLERPARAVGEPLGIARGVQGRWRIEAPREDLGAHIKSLLGDGAALSGVEAALGKSEWGLRPEQTHIVLCALLRAGDLMALDARGNALAPGTIGMPLRRAVYALRPGHLLDAPAWERLRALAALLNIEPLGAISFAEQERARSLLALWRENALAETELTQARLHQLRRRLQPAGEVQTSDNRSAPWPHTEAAREHVAALLNALNGEGATLEVLARAASLDLETLRPALDDWGALSHALDEKQADLLAAHALLTHPQLAIPPDLQAERAALLARFDAGEAILEDAELLPRAQAWRAAYAAQYRNWHNAQHDAARFASYRRLANDDVLRALERLSTLNNRAFEHGPKLRLELAAELEKGCLRDGTLRPDEATCSACHLKWNQRLRLRDPRELENMALQGIGVLQQSLAEPAVRDYLARNLSGATLLEWDGAVSALLPLLDEATLHALDEALRPRRRVSRATQALHENLAACRTRAEFRAAFNTWLDAGDNLADDDEIVLDSSGE